eukprot:7851882-Pyramimonas_sp.AAC.1
MRKCVDVYVDVDVGLAVDVDVDVDAGADGNAAVGVDVDVAFLDAPTPRQGRTGIIKMDPSLRTVHLQLRTATVR